MIITPVMFRSSTQQVAGLWPFSVVNSFPKSGILVGKDIHTYNSIYMDPFNWFEEARLISNPSLMILGQPGLGKSTLVSRIIFGLQYQGVTPLILGDLKPDYSDIIKSLNGHSVSLGTTSNSTNILNIDIPTNISDHIKLKILKKLVNRTYLALATLIEIIQKDVLKVYEDNILLSTLEIMLLKGGDNINDLISLLENPSDELLSKSKFSKDKFRIYTEELIPSIITLTNRVPELFDINSKNNIPNSFSALSFDISNVDEEDTIKTSCSMIAAWHIGMSHVTLKQILADHKIEKQRNYLIIFDELWRPLSSNSSIITRLNELTRLNRNKGVAQIMITHSLDDMDAVVKEEDKAKTRTFVRKAGIVVTFGLSSIELKELSKAIDYNEREQELIKSWSSPEDWNNKTIQPGRGKFLIKVGSRIGIPCQMVLTDIEKRLHNTESKFNNKG